MGNTIYMATLMTLCTNKDFIFGLLGKIISNIH